MMRNQGLCGCMHQMRQKGKRLLHTMQEPTVHHTMHYHCGVYRKPSAREPIMGLHVDPDCSAPLLRVALIVGGAMLIIGALSATVAKLCCCGKSSHHCM